jgi:hypothetical protein
MAITRPVSFSYAIIGDGETQNLAIDLGPLIALQGLPESLTPSRIISLTTSTAEDLTGELIGQTIKLTFKSAPLDAKTMSVYMTLGF